MMRLTLILTITFLSILNFSCGRTIIDPAFDTESKITNNINSPIKIYFYKHNTVDSSSLSPGNSHALTRIASDSPEPIFFDIDSIIVKFRNNKIKRDINCNKLTSTSMYIDCINDTVSVYNANRHIKSNYGNNLYLQYLIEAQDSLEAK